MLHEASSGAPARLAGSLLVAGLALTLAACGTSEGEKFDTGPSTFDTGPVADAGPGGDGTTTDGGKGDAGKLWPCKEPGKVCNAHDPCAINPICGKDLLCHPQARQNCDDGLTCTVDICKGRGACEHKPAKDTCALVVRGKAGAEIRCFKKDDINPGDACQICDPDRDTQKWSGRTGGKCDDKNACTDGDTCQDGLCKGKYFGNECSDGADCTKDICVPEKDRKPGDKRCKHVFKTDRCLIDKRCYKTGALDPSGCLTCDPKKSQYKWTPLPSLCKIGGKCHKPGARDNTGCGVCDPKANATGWTPIKDKCLISGICYAKGTLDSTKCSTCDPLKSKTKWSPLPKKCLIFGTCYNDGAASPSACATCASATSATWWTPKTTAKKLLWDFESGMEGFKVDLPIGDVAWRRSSKRAKSGKWSLYYGNSKFTGYDSKTVNNGSATSAKFTLPAGQHAALIFWLYMDTETSSNFDVLKVSVKAGATLWKKDKRTTMPLDRYKKWVPVEVDLSAYAGKTIQLEFNFNTVDAWNNIGEGVYVDGLTILTSCGPLKKAP